MDDPTLTLDDLTDEQLVEGFMHTYGMDRAQAERHTAIARGEIPVDVVREPPAAKP